jgi:hypothetical protein
VGRQAAIDRCSGWSHCVSRAGLNIELELGSPGPKLNDVTRHESRCPDNPLFIQIGSIAAVQVCECKLGWVCGILSYLGVLAPDQIIPVWVKFHGYRWIPPGHKLSKVRQRKLLNLIRF